MTNERLYNLRAGNIQPANEAEKKMLDNLQTELTKIFDQEMGSVVLTDEQTGGNPFKGAN